MKSLHVRLDPATREELYADIHHNLLDFIIIEAIFNVCTDLKSRPEKLIDASTDPEFYLNDPDISIASSEEYLLDVLKSFDKADGVDVEAEDYNIEDHRAYIGDKLCLAISSITVANQPLDFMNFYEVLNDPELAKGLTINGTHLGNTVILMLEGATGLSYL